MTINDFKTIFEKNSKAIFNNLDLIDILKKPFEYSFFSGGKRLRPWIIYNIGRYYNIEKDSLFNIGFAVELLHTASLIHDDLPSIDNSNFRRGNVTNHKKFGEWRALLTGDVGFIIPFKIFSSFAEKEANILTKFFSETIIKLIEGETLDVAFEKGNLSPQKSDVETMYNKKTSALFEFSFAYAPLLLNRKKEFELLKKVGRNFGLSFQIYDDIKDINGNFNEVGKDLNNDQEKITFLKVTSYEEAKNYADTKFNEAISILSKLNFNTFTQELIKIKSLIERM
ncbi:polyprenyl synthetase family protein [Marinitoga arctica]